VVAVGRVVYARFEGGVLRPLGRLELEEGEVVRVAVFRGAGRVFGCLLRRRPSLKPGDVDRVIEEIECEGVL